jgi:hypothetical protein
MPCARPRHVHTHARHLVQTLDVHSQCTPSTTRTLNDTHHVAAGHLALDTYAHAGCLALCRHAHTHTRP